MRMKDSNKMNNNDYKEVLLCAALSSNFKEQLPCLSII